jgi:hypothetical protein
MDAVHRRFNYKPDAETEALKLSPEPQDVLNVMEEGIKQEFADLQQQEIGSDPRLG